MSQPDKTSGRRRDIPQSPTISQNTTVSGGTGADFEHIIYYTPNLTLITPTGEAGDLPLNAMNVRIAFLVWEVTMTGQTTNFFTMNFNQRRAGALLVSTNSATTVTGAGQFTITPASMANIQLNSRLVFSGGSGTAETVVVQAVTATTFTATFANGHSGGYTIAAAPLATITYSSTGVSDAAHVPHVFQVPMGSWNAILPGDTVTIARVSNNGTGQVSQAFTAGVDLVPSGIYL